MNREQIEKTPTPCLRSADMERKETMIMYDYDITMCKSAICQLASTCHRHLQYKRYLKDNSPDKPEYISIYQATNSQIDKKCAMYWEEKGDIK